MATSTVKLPTPPVKTTVRGSDVPLIVRSNATSPLKPSEAVRPKLSVVAPSSPLSTIGSASEIPIKVGAGGSTIPAGTNSI
ncbi:hypothetical protein HALTITAN_3308 [Vreelandella titanicae BH1]|uniref:Uncharacterized protein n=1 Tax=Vreelandella titanicae BH1 TaxID=1204738 RepID=L9U647_9GAMM|nr:hypothetical protein HALTITAN_3308 [Halomonas titanicae BH1]